MIVDVKDLIPEDNKKAYRYEELNTDGTGTGKFLHLKYAPGDLIQEPTPIDRSLLMAMQGFTPCETIFNRDGSITEKGASGTKTTVFNSHDLITETFTDLKGFSIRKKIIFEGNRNVREELD